MAKEQHSNQTRKKEKRLMLFLLFVLIGSSGLYLGQSKLKKQFIVKDTSYAEQNIKEQELILDDMLQDTAIGQSEEDNIQLNAKAAVLMDASNQRVLYGKDEDEVLAMASTTKIMTCILALEYGEKVPLDTDYATVSSYAASQPKVKANLRTGEEYCMADLLYSMMLESHNDTAVVVAEHIGRWLMTKENASQEELTDSKACVHAFAAWMNEKAKELGCKNTHFVTPNGLDATDEAGAHGTTAKELGMIASYAIQKDNFRNIIQTASYSFCDKTGQHTVSANNKDAYLSMDENAIGIKTGFTNQAGYCFVGAKENELGTFITVVLGCGWPPEKTKKWTDTKKLMAYGNSQFERQDIVVNKSDSYLQVEEGVSLYCHVTSDKLEEKSILLGKNDQISLYKYTLGRIIAPVQIGELVGYRIVCINGQIWKKIPIRTEEKIEKWNIGFCIDKIAQMWIL